MRARDSVAARGRSSAGDGAAYSAPPPALAQPITGGRTGVAGKFFTFGQEKAYLRGVTYGPFRPDEAGECYGDAARAAGDLAMMRRAGMNCVRVYTAPPRWLLDCAAAHGLRVLVGVPWVQNVAFFDNRALLRDCLERVRETARRCRGHPALLGYAIGNEIPAPVVRWYGHGRIERHIRALCDLSREADPEGLVTYVNYPSTEYLDLSCVDFVSFNVYLEAPDKLRAYLARLQNIAGERPLVMAEVGLDSHRNGEEAQASSLGWQVRTAFEGGCAGLFAFSWTDEWHREGHDIVDWKFGLTDHARRPKPALGTVSAAYADVPCLRPGELPSASVVVCTYNGSRTLGRCLASLGRLEYPDYEVIVVDDGSRDAVPEIARRFPVRLISTPNRGLSSARNTGMEAARGEIVAYIDDDAYADPQWLAYLARTLLDGGHAGVGGPNLPVPGDGMVAQCVAHAPGGPTHVLLTDTEAEHIPGCNMAFRKSALQEVGGCDPIFRIAGDDVDLCWRLQERGWTLGFSPAAMVWHHRRNRVRAFWRQQVNYGRAETDLERKWPGKYNAFGHPTWAGRLYGRGAAPMLLHDRRRIYHGVWGVALFQHVYPVRTSLLWAMPTMPEWYVLTVLLTGGSALGLVWPPLLLCLPLLLLALALATLQAAMYATRAEFEPDSDVRLGVLKWRLLTGVLCRLQPLARLLGRVHYGLTPWRLRGVSGFAWPGARDLELWCKRWRWPAERLHRLEGVLAGGGAAVLRGDAFSRWDLELRGGLIGAVRARQLTEDLADGAQLVRLRVRPRFARAGVLMYLLLTTVGVGAVLQQIPWLAATAGLLGVGVVLLGLRESAAAMATLVRAARASEER